MSTNQGGLFPAISSSAFHQNQAGNVLRDTSSSQETLPAHSHGTHGDSCPSNHSNNNGSHIPEFVSHPSATGFPANTSVSLSGFSGMTLNQAVPVPGITSGIPGFPAVTLHQPVPVSSTPKVQQTNIPLSVHPGISASNFIPIQNSSQEHHDTVSHFKDNQNNISRVTHFSEANPAVSRQTHPAMSWQTVMNEQDVLPGVTMTRKVAGSAENSFASLSTSIASSIDNMQQGSSSRYQNQANTVTFTNHTLSMPDVSRNVGLSQDTPMVADMSPPTSIPAPVMGQGQGVRKQATFLETLAKYSEDGPEDDQFSELLEDTTLDSNSKNALII